MLSGHLDALIEAIADGSVEADAEARAHLGTCQRCAARLERARSLEQLLSAREQPAPPASFTATVMARIAAEKWKTERVVDIGFNLALAAGVLVILAGAVGLAASLGVFTITVDVRALLDAATAEVDGRVINQLQTVGIAAALLTTALVLWWWTETTTD